MTIANPRGTHQSSDYQLTALGTGKPVTDEAGSKQLEATFTGLNVQLAFTGVAKVSNRRTIDWLLDELKALPQNSDLQNVCDALARRSAAEMKPLGSSGVLTLVLTAAAAGKPFRVAVISNTLWGENSPHREGQLRYPSTHNQEAIQFDLGIPEIRRRTRTAATQVSCESSGQNPKADT